MKGVLVTLGLTAAMVSVAVQRDVKPQVTADKRWEAPDGQVVEGVGVCSVAIDGVNCWNMQGAAAPELTDRVKAFFVRTDITYRLGKRNRWLVIRKSSRSGGNYTTPTGGYLQEQSLDYNSNEMAETILHWTDDSGDNTASIVATVFSENKDKVPPIPFKSGTVADVNGLRIEIGKCKELAPLPKVQDPQMSRYRGMPIDGGLPGARRWSVVMGFSASSDGSPRGPAQFVPLDAQGMQIRFVDRNGQPASSVKALESVDPTRPSGFGQFTSPKYAAAQFQSMGQAVPDAAAYSTNVDPAKIAALQMAQPMNQTRVLITGFPLEPAK